MAGAASWEVVYKVLYREQTQQYQEVQPFGEDKSAQPEAQGGVMEVCIVERKEAWTVRKKKEITQEPIGNWSREMGGD